MSRDGCVALPHGAMVLSAVCNCGISCSYSLTIFVKESPIRCDVTQCGQIYHNLDAVPRFCDLRILET